MEDLLEIYLKIVLQGGLFIHVLLIYIGIFLAVGLAAHILNAIGLSAMAKHRGLPRAALAWFPLLGVSYMTGAIADLQRQEETENDPKLRYWLSAAMLVLLVLGAVLMVKIFNLEIGVQGNAPEPAFLVILGLFLVFGVPFTLAWHFANFRLFKACQPDNSVLFMILSIFLGIGPVLVFALRHYVHGQRVE